MRVMTVGDVVGPDAARWLSERLPELRDRHQLDYVVVNAENAAVTGRSPVDGFGMTHAVLEPLLDAGVDVITGGNHSWDGPEVDMCFAHPQVLRPANVVESRGRGSLTVGPDGKRLTVVNLLSVNAVGPGCLAPTPAKIWDAWTVLVDTLPPSDAVVVDLHSGSPSEKAWFAGAVDGRVAAVVGTHTHDATHHAHVLPGGTGFVAELGMAGRLGFSGYGFDPAHMVAAFRGEDTASLPAFQLASGEFTLGAAIFDIDNGRTVCASRVR